MDDNGLCNNAVATPGKRGFQPGNPGRPRGSRNRATILAENVLSKDIKKIAEVVSKAALEGDMVAARLVMERLIAPIKSRAVRFQMRKIESVADISAAMQDLWEAVSSGAITIDEMLSLTAVLEKHASAVAALEAAPQPATTITSYRKISS
jgi:hypothetical protein